VSKCLSAVPVMTQSNALKHDLSIRIFIQSHSTETFTLAKERFSNFSWAFPVLITGADENNVLFENKFYVEFEKHVNREDYNSFEYIGFLSYSAPTKISMHQIVQNIEALHHKNFVHFSPSPILISNSVNVNTHKNFKVIWNDVFNDLGDTNHAFDSNWNYFVMKKNMFFEYQKYLKCKIPILLSHNLALTDANYKSGKNPICIERVTNGLKFYPHVPFVLERVCYNWCRMYEKSIEGQILNIFVYSVNIGNYDNQTKHVEQKTRHHITFKTFTTNDEMQFEGRHDYEICHRYRMGTHFMNLNNYDIAVYLDANVSIRREDFIDILVNNFLDKKWDFLMTKHEARNNAHDELKECLNVSKFSRPGLAMMKQFIGNDTSQLCWCGFNAQWLKSPNRTKVIQMFDDWWKCLQDEPTGVANDQIIFPFIRTRHNINMTYWNPEYFANNFFQINVNANHAKTIKDYIKKTFNYESYCSRYSLNFKSKEEALDYFCDFGLYLGHRI
jgi:hypothetical protein